MKIDAKKSAPCNPQGRAQFARKAVWGISLCLLLVCMLESRLVAGSLPGRYYPLLEAAAAKVEAKLNENPNATLEEIEKSGREWFHFPYAILPPTVLYAKKHSQNPRYGDTKMRDLAIRIGDLLADAHERGIFEPRLDSDWDTYMWMETYRLLEKELGEARKARWKKAIEENVATLVENARDRVDFPWYTSLYVGTSPNHYALWASNLHFGGKLLGNREWEELGSRILKRFIREQSAGGYWGEHSRDMPTIGYNHLTLSAVAMYYEYTGDKDALPVLERAKNFHMNFTFLDGMAVDVVNDRNRYWHLSGWSQFAFSHFPDGRGYAEFLVDFFEPETLNMSAAGRLAQDALYYHEGRVAEPPQRKQSYFHQLHVPASIRKVGPWQVALSGLVDTTDIQNQFFLDRQGHVSVFHKKAGLIITGANSKRQPELATFTETPRETLLHLPLNSRLQVENGKDRLSLAYTTFFADIYPEMSEDAVDLRVVISGRGRPGPDTRMNLQLVLKAGEVLETGAGKRITLGEDKIELSPADLGGSIRHRGWTLAIPEGASLTWPVRPFYPYSAQPDPNIENAVGRLTLPMTLTPRQGKYVRPAELEFRFRITAE
jgi:hypothetical protein